MGVLMQQVAERPLLVHSVISSHLTQLGYPQKSINSMLMCGKPTGFFVNKECGCKPKALPIKHHCSLRTCERCSKIRKRRIFSKYLPFFKKYKITSKDFFQFLTISPKNYKSLEEGFKDIKKAFSRFLRRSYIKNRIKAGFYVLETKQSKRGDWNIHIHAVIYGQWLDYRIRGHCNKCGQNLMKYNKKNNTFYCANRKCGSIDVKAKKSTKLGKEWFLSSGKKNKRTYAHIYGERVKKIHGAIAYLTKYIAVDKTEIQSEKALAEYIFYTRKKKLINAFGLFYKDKLDNEKRVNICQECGQEATFFIDLEVTLMLLQSQKPPDNLGEERQLFI